MELKAIVDPTTILQAVAEMEIPTEINVQDDLDSITVRSGWQSEKTSESTRMKYQEAESKLKERTDELIQAKREGKEYKRKIEEQGKIIANLQETMGQIMAQMSIKSNKKKTRNERENESDSSGSISSRSSQVETRAQPSGGTGSG